MKLPPRVAQFVQQVRQHPAIQRARRHPIATGSACVMLLVLLIVLGSSGGNSTPQTAYFEAIRGHFTVSITEGGTLEAVNETIVRNEVGGRESRIITLVEEGSYVKEGDLLVEFDSMAAQEELDEGQIEFEKAQFALIQSEQELEIQKSVVESEVRAAELKVQFAEMDLEKYLEGEAKVELLTASNNITKTVAQLSIDRDTMRWSEELYEKGFETRNVLDRDQLSVTNQELTLQIQQMTLWMIKNFDFERKKTELASNVEEAKNELDRVKQQGERKLAQFRAEVTTQSNTVKLNELKLERERINLAATKIYAPQDGLVVYAASEGRFSSESMIEEGATVRRRQALIKLPDISEMKVSIKVHESHVNMVQRGQPAFVVLDSLPDQRFAAYVDRVGLLPDSQSRWGNPNLKVYDTEIVITDPLPDVKPGVSARAEIVVTNIEDAVSVPIQAVTTLNGKQVVYRRARGKDVPSPVEIGMFNTRFIQILEGLEEGDRVLLTPPYDTQEQDIEGDVLTSGEATTLTNTPTVPREARSADSSGERQGPESRQFAGSGEADQASGRGGDTAGADVREGMRQQFEQMRAKFDKDGDGELDETERQAMREELQSRFGAGGGAREAGRGERGGRESRDGGSQARPE